MQGKSSLLPAEPAATITVATDYDCLTYTVAQAARLAGVSVSYYYRAAHQGLVPAKFLGRRIVVPKTARQGRWRRCCAGPMQFNLTDGPPSTWARHGRGNVYDPADAIPAAARKLVADGARRDLDRAIYGYNHSWAYVARVKQLARRYGGGR